ncbi:putative proteinase inhibitor I3, Kunitz legume, kunitz inhibitor STI-like superfamily [Helianthus annuus]|nr:putative proteinase inhibitor I3, Kunitz legume, kunitz inhibitor STI-like superfamily [Helianthus annuus]KAJ0635012.1 putative proteinase inhibitor I3, Kunitz legume, kunitz inhibitor STI-like superfamily [Helianthus annuus]KAJ0824741.1 putative proteinase inhibitor I3, Kunitz legume, kunitz inhibitor STI-like superfamily [Helianthus annuus]
MKITFSIIFITALSLLSATSATIYDSSGNKLLRGTSYYIVPLLRGSGGGLTVSSQSHKNACPLDIAQEPFEVNNGVPFTFSPILLDAQVIREAYPVAIEADVINPCTGSTIWTVTTAKNHDHGFVTGKKDDDKKKKDDDKKKEDDDKKKKDDDDDDDDDKDRPPVQVVTTGGKFNKPESCFQIVENNMMPGLQSYQIQNCPFKCGSSSTGLVCYNIGVIADSDGNRYLGRTDAVFPVVFTNSYGTVRPSAKTSSFSEISTKVSTFSRSGK